MANETNLTRLIMLALGKLKNIRIFRNNTGTGWVGKSARKGNMLIIQDPRPLHAGLCEGSSDLIGWTERTVTPDMVGKPVAIFTAIEVKTGDGRATEAQLNFIARVRAAGGIAGIARSEREAVTLVQHYAR